MFFSYRKGGLDSKAGVTKYGARHWSYMNNTALDIFDYDSLLKKKIFVSK